MRETLKSEDVMETYGNILLNPSALESVELLKLKLTNLHDAMQDHVGAYARLVGINISWLFMRNLKVWMSKQ